MRGETGVAVVDDLDIGRWWWRRRRRATARLDSYRVRNHPLVRIIRQPHHQCIASDGVRTPEVFPPHVLIEQDIRRKLLVDIHRGKRAASIENHKRRVSRPVRVVGPGRRDAINARRHVKCPSGDVATIAQCAEVHVPLEALARGHWPVSLRGETGVAVVDDLDIGRWGRRRVDCGRLADRIVPEVGIRRARRNTRLVGNYPSRAAVHLHDNRVLGRATRGDRSQRARRHAVDVLTATTCGDQRHTRGKRVADLRVLGVRRPRIVYADQVSQLIARDDRIRCVRLGDRQIRLQWRVVHVAHHHSVALCVGG